MNNKTLAGVFSALVLFLSTAVFAGTTPEYFGYYGADRAFDDNGVQSFSRLNLDRIVELNNTNIVMVLTSPLYYMLDASGSDNLRGVLETAKENNMKVWIAVFDLFFSWDPESSGIRDSAVYINYWNQLMSIISPSEGIDYLDVVYGFYFDEPIGNHVNEADFVEATEFIRKTGLSSDNENELNDFKILTIFSTESFSELDTAYIQYITDIGYDYYGKDGWDHSGRIQYNDPSFPWKRQSHAEFTRILATIASPEAYHYWGVAGAAVWTDTSPTPIQPFGTRIDSPYDAIHDLAEWYRFMTQGSESIQWKGLLCFDFASNSVTPAGGSTWIGLDKLFFSNDYKYKAPEKALKNIHIAIGQAICSDTSDYYMASHDFSNQQNVKGWQYRDDQIGYMEWSTDDNHWVSTVPNEPFCYITSNRVHTGSSVSAVRAWRAPKSGYIRIVSNGNFRKVHYSQCGDGVNIRLYKANVVNGTLHEIKSIDIEAKDIIGIPLNTMLHITKGEELLFIVYKKRQSQTTGNNSCDNIKLDPIITYVDPPFPASAINFLLLN